MTKGKIVYLLYESFYKWVHHKVFLLCPMPSKMQNHRYQTTFLTANPAGKWHYTQDISNYHGRGENDIRLLTLVETCLLGLAAMSPPNDGSRSAGLSSSADRFSWSPVSGFTDWLALFKGGFTMLPQQKNEKRFAANQLHPWCGSYVYELLHGSVWITIRIRMNYYTDPNPRKNLIISIFPQKIQFLIKYIYAYTVICT